MSKLLIIDDDADICMLLKRFFGRNGFEVQTAARGKKGIALLRKSAVDIVLCDFKLPDYTGIEILQKIKILHPSIQVIIITGYSDVGIAVEALKKGAYDYVTKPLIPDEILHTVKTALKSKTEGIIQKTPNRRQSKDNTTDYIRGISQQAVTIEKHIDLISPTDMSVVILGETGTGKEYIARAIHNRSHRKDKEFVAVDCGALPGELAGSELFGHMKGAFTGAVTEKMGFFEHANGGTLFLDEIVNLSYENQIKLLRVLQEKAIRRLGGVNDISVDVRIIVATNENLSKAVRTGDFREDVYHRINEFKIEIPPIRERPADTLVFARYFLKSANAELNRNVSDFDDSVIDVIERYYWHGNLRELRNVVKRSVLMCKEDTIRKEHLPQEIVSPAQNSEAQISMSFNGKIPESLKQVVEQAEKEAIQEVLKFTNNNKSEAASLLKVDRKTLYNKLKAYNISE